MGMYQGHILRVMLACLSWVPATLTDHTSLPAPGNISMKSIDLRHDLVWNPLPDYWGNVTYSVQYQGEYERNYTKRWNEAEDCQATLFPMCNVTKEISTKLPYTLRVQAMLGNLTSDWAELHPPFSRSNTILTHPVFTLRAIELQLFVDVQDMGQDFQYFVLYWRKGQEDMVHSVTSSYATNIRLEKVEGGTEYCAQVITHARPIGRNSSASHPLCIEVQVPTARLPALITGMISFFGVIAGLVLISVLLWYVYRMLRYSCCPSVDIPDMLMEPYSCPEKIQYAVGETCESITGIEFTEQILFLPSNSVPA